MHSNSMKQIAVENGRVQPIFVYSTKLLKFAAIDLDQVWRNFYVTALILRISNISQMFGEIIHNAMKEIPV